MPRASHLRACQDFTGDPCEEVVDAAALPSDWTEVGAVVGVVYRDDDGRTWTHALTGELLVAPGFLLIESPGVELDAVGLVGSQELV